MYFSWSRGEAIDYFTRKTGISQSEAAKQVDRFITIPAQALADKVGHFKILQLREHAEEVLGNYFNTIAHTNPSLLLVLF